VWKFRGKAPEEPRPIINLVLAKKPIVIEKALRQIVCLRNRVALDQLRESLRSSLANKRSVEVK
jgi:hypothetical protein